MKKISTSILLMATIAVAISFTACKKKVSDADILAAIETAMKADPMANGTIGSVDKGVVTISGVFKDDASQAHCIELIKGIKGVKSVVNNCTVAVMVPPVIEADDPLTKSVTDAIKDFPGVIATIKDGIVTLTGEISRDKLQKLMMGLQEIGRAHV